MGKSWKRLHRLAYVIPLVVVGHFLLAVKGNLGRLQGNLLVPLLFGVVIVILLVLRIPAVKARFARKPR